MKKVALVFVLAVLLPSLVLAWLAVRSLRDQQFLLERQQSQLDQHLTDGLAQDVSTYLAQQQQAFGAEVESLAAAGEPRTLATQFDAQLRAHWPLAEVGFCVTTEGKLLSPPANARPAAQRFRLDNSSFLGNREPVEVYLANNAYANNGAYNSGLANNSGYSSPGLANSLANNSWGAGRSQVSPSSAHDPAPASSLANNSRRGFAEGASPAAANPAAALAAVDSPTAGVEPQPGAVQVAGLDRTANSQNAQTPKISLQSRGLLVADNRLSKVTPGQASQPDGYNPAPASLLANNSRRGLPGAAAPRAVADSLVTGGGKQSPAQAAGLVDASHFTAAPARKAGRQGQAFLLVDKSREGGLPEDNPLANAGPAQESPSSGVDSAPASAVANDARRELPGVTVAAANPAAAPPATEDSPASGVENQSGIPAAGLANSSLANPLNYKAAQTRKVSPQSQAYQLVEPARAQGEENNLSRVVPAEAEFRQLIGDQTDGLLARFLQNQLKLMCWHRLRTDPGLIFGAQLNLDRVVAELRSLVTPGPWGDEICLAILDDNAKPVVVSRAGFQANWKRPFVATEVGDALPHWEVAAYLVNPARLTQAAQTAKLTLGLLVALLVTAIGTGSLLIVRSLGAELKLARQKTDFVSNVSHELKTPLTSIRMFSELLAEGRVTDPVKQRSYLQIITAEAARLTRLINNVLDFSRMEGGQKKYSFQPCDLADLVRGAGETFRPHLEAAGFQFQCDEPAAPVAVRGDADALSQVIVNLLSNAEKYSGGGKEIVLQLAMRQSPLPHAEVRVLDRGPGVPRGSEEKIFEQFYRAHDSLSSGIQGSGLGLTIARQIARVHGGDVGYEPRAGGGSVFVLRLPVKTGEGQA